MSPVSPGSLILIFLSSGARIAPSAIGTLYVLLVRVSFISSALPDEAAAGGLAESLVGALATGYLPSLEGAAVGGLLLFFLAAGRAVEPVFGICSPVDYIKFSATSPGVIIV